ncbi:MAG: hypothetical protein GY739_16720 [Mesoflavibacter sp.]|nr:hypothetical protein [Mesoflavibacter sp.]
MTTKKKEQCTIPVVGSSTLSMCCKSGVVIVNTLNDIKCYKCSKCGNLTGVEDEYGRRCN